MTKYICGHIGKNSTHLFIARGHNIECFIVLVTCFIVYLLPGKKEVVTRIVGGGHCIE